MKKLLFSLSRAVMKETFTGYSSKAPTSLTSQFPDRVGRTEAVEGYEKRKQKSSTQLFPIGKLIIFEFFSCRISVCFCGSHGTVLS